MRLNLNRLNRPQQNAVLHDFGPLLILAGAGSGKTNTMSYRIAHLIAERNVPPSSVLGLSFTNKAATELKERVVKLISEAIGRKAVRGLMVTTFHSLCVRILRAHAEKLGFQRSFTILDQNDQIDVLKQVLRNIKIDDRKFDPQLILFEIGQAKNRFLTTEQTESFFLESKRLSEDYAVAAFSSFQHYQDQLKILNAMDFDDLIFYTVQLLTQISEIRDQYNYQFRHILVDEYQDTNAAQFKILQLLTEKQQNLCVVGDDDQSIYAWRGADPSHILGFTRHFPEAKTVVLEQNYRSTNRILEAAHHVIAKNNHRHPKKLWSDRGEGELLSEIIVEEDRAEAEFVAEEILRRTSDQSRTWEDFAILYRSNAQSRVFEEALRRRGISYKILGGLSFLERKEVKNVLAYWRLIVNPKDDAALRRVLNWPARGIGKTSVEILSQYAFQQEKPLFESFLLCSQLTPKAKAAVIEFHKLILQLRQELEVLNANPQNIADWARRTLERLEIKKAVEEESDDPVQAGRKWENVEELIHSVGQFVVSDEVLKENHSSPIEEGQISQALSTSGILFLQEFLNRMTLEAQDTEKEEKDTSRNQVTLLTLHGAKGLEYPIVFMVGMEEGFLPHKRTLEEITDLSEERRLCYVGITRAKDLLFLTRAQNRIRYGKPVPRTPSRFLAEIPKELLFTTNQASGPDLSSEASRQEHENQVKNYLAEIRAQLLKK